MSLETTTKGGGSVSKQLEAAGEDGENATLDSVYSAIGSLGLWQISVLFTIAYIQFFSGMVTITGVFLQITPPYQCNELVRVQDASAEMFNRSEDPCYVLEPDRFEVEFNRSDPSDNKCHNWTFATNDSMSSTIVSQYGLVCDKKWYYEHSQSVYMFGVLIGSLVGGPISDRIGRKPAAVLSVAAQCLLGSVESFTPDYFTFVVVRFFMAAALIAGSMSCYTYAMEILIVSHRTTIGGLYFLPYALGYASLSLVAFLVRDWRWMHFISSAPIILAVVVLMLFVPESPRWLLSKGRVAKAEAVLRRIATVNQTDWPHNLDIYAVASSAHNNKYRATTTTHNIVHIFQLEGGKFKHPALVARAVNLFFNWFVNSMVYYGISLNIGALAGDVFWNSAIMGLVEVPGYAVSVPLLWWGRRRALCASLATAGVALLLTPWTNSPWLQLVLVLMGKVGITSSFGIVYVFTSEVYPTVVRASGLSSSSCVARIGSMLAPYVASLGKVDASFAFVPSVVFGALSLCAGATALLLPETKGTQLAESLEHAALTGKRNNARQLAPPPPPSPDDYHSVD